jgi:hypothetical protein
VAGLPLTPDAAAPTSDASDRAAVVRWYHRHTKHHPRRYAPGPGHLDWATRPDPFRTFAGAPTVPLPLAADRLTATFADLHRPGAVSPRPVECANPVPARRRA